VAAILLLSEVMPSPCSYCVKEGLVYIALASPLFWQPFSYSECTKLNIQSLYNVYLVSNAKCARSITFNSLRVP